LVTVVVVVVVEGDELDVMATVPDAFGSVLTVFAS
jgi:hypothetical protein